MITNLKGGKKYLKFQGHERYSQHKKEGWETGQPLL
jgi:hypothetical protein